MSEHPKWSSLIDNNNQIRRRRIHTLQLDVWHPPDPVISEHPTRGYRNMCTHRTHFEPEPSEFSPPIHDDETSNTNANNDISLSIIDNSDNGTSSDREHDIMGLESDGSEANDETEEMEDENTLQHEDPLKFVLSSDSDDREEGLHGDQVSVKQFTNRKASTKVDSFISAMESIPHVVEPPDVPSKKELRTPLSLRLATLVRRARSDMVVRLHTNTNDSDANESHAQVFTAYPAFFPSASRSIHGHVVATAANGDILVISTTLINESQWEHLKQPNSLKCSLLITLTPPWRELVIPGSEKQQKRIIFSPSSANFQVISQEINTLVIQRIPLLCDCIQKDPTGTTWYSCTYRFGCKATKRSTSEHLCASGSGQLYVLVLHKSLLWFQKRLKIAFLVKLSNGSLSMFLFPPSVCRQWPLGGGNEASTSGRMTIGSMMNPGCVYSVKTLPVVATASDTGLTRKAQRLWSGLTEFLKSNERLAQFVALNDAPNELDLFLLKKAAKFHLVLEITAFSQATILPPFSPLLSSSSRCILNGVLLYEFPSGSLIAERILAGNQGTLIDNDHHQLSTALVILTESTHSQSAVYLILCSADAVTPLTLLITSDHLSPCVALAYGQHCSYRVRVSIVGAIVARGFFILDEFSRVELIEAVRLSEGRLDHTRSYPLPGFRHRNASLVTLEGNILGQNLRKVALDGFVMHSW